MPVAPSTRCDECGRSMDRARLVRNGRALCDSCGMRVPLAPCKECGGNTRSINDEGLPFCKRCRTKGRSCLRCGKPLPQASLLVEGGAVCWPCARHYREPEACEQCGQMELTLIGINATDGSRRVCSRCWRHHHGYATCSVCRKSRRPVAATPDGKPVCKRCHESGENPFVCPKCGEAGVRYSATRCLSCYQRDTVQKRLSEASRLLQRDWARESWLGFGAALLVEMRPEKAMANINRYYLLFARLDAAFAKPAEITPSELLATAGGKDGLRRFAVPYGYLVKCGTIPATTRTLLADTAESVRQGAMIENVEGKWFASVLSRYRDYLMAIRARYDSRGWKGEKSRMKARTITSNLRSARKFCETMEAEGVVMIQQATPDHLNKFLELSPGHTASIRSFVRFLNRKEKLFQTLSIKTIRRDLPEGIFLSKAKYQTLLKNWLSPADDVLRESLIGLFLLLYAQTIKGTVSIRLEDLSQRPDGRYRIAFGRTEINLDARVSNILCRYLERRRALAIMDNGDDNPYLFPGRQFGGHLTAAAVTYWLAKVNVRAEQLFATALYNAYLNGLRLPKVLVNAFGITSATAVKYLNMIDPRLTIEIEQKALAA